MKNKYDIIVAGGGFAGVAAAITAARRGADVLLIEKVNLLKVAQVIGKYKDGKFADYPHLIRHLQTDRMVIRCDKETPINLDGELRVSDVVDIRLAKEKLRFFYPKGLTYKLKAPATV